MALYNFKCPSCKHEFEKLLRMDAENPECPKCGHETEKVLTRPSILEFTGDGFYKTGAFH